MLQTRDWRAQSERRRASGLCIQGRYRICKRSLQSCRVTFESPRTDCCTQITIWLSAPHHVLDSYFPNYNGRLMQIEHQWRKAIQNSRIPKLWTRDRSMKSRRRFMMSLTLTSNPSPNPCKMQVRCLGPTLVHLIRHHESLSVQHASNS